MSDLSILLEYYAGNARDKRFKQCEECLKELIQEMKPQQNLDVRYNVMRKRQDYSFHPANMKLRELLAGIFNMKGVNLYWSIGMINAYTYPPTILRKIQNRENVEAKDKKKVNMTAHIVLFEELITEANLNEKELLAVILHEMGHNFSFLPLTMYASVIQSTILLPVIILRKLVEMGTHFLNDKIIYKYLYPVENLFGMANDIMKTISRLSGFAQTLDILEKLLSGKMRLGVPTDPLTISIMIGSYQDERASDSFCAVYGYGPYQISALNKMHSHKYTTARQIVDTSGLTNSYHMINDMNAVILEPLYALIMEPHPNINVRYHNIRRKMESDLKSKNLPKGYKKELEEQLQEMDKIYQKLDTYSDDDMITLRKSIYKVLDQLTEGHSDWREIFSPVLDTGNF